MATIEFNYETAFRLKEEKNYSDWLTRIIVSEEHKVGEINFVFCDDNYLLQMNQRYLNHDTLTDVITFDYCEDGLVNGDIFISEERVKENAVLYMVEFETELKRVMAHGVLHLLGYKDKSHEDTLKMRSKEEEKMKLFHVEQ